MSLFHTEISYQITENGVLEGKSGVMYVSDFSNRRARYKRNITTFVLLVASNFVYVRCFSDKTPRYVCHLLNLVFIL